MQLLLCIVTTRSFCTLADKYDDDDDTIFIVTSLHLPLEILLKVSIFVIQNA